MFTKKSKLSLHNWRKILKTSFGWNISKKPVPAFRDKNMWSLFWYGFRYQKLRGGLVKISRHRPCDGTPNAATVSVTIGRVALLSSKNIVLSSYSTVRYMAIARLCLSLQLRCRSFSLCYWRIVVISLARETLPWLVRALGPYWSHHSNFHVILLLLLPKKVAQCLNMPLSFW